MLTSELLSCVESAQPQIGAKLAASFVQSRRSNQMKCKRCESDKEAEFRVISEFWISKCARIVPGKLAK